MNNGGTLLLSGAGGTDNKLNTAAGVTLAGGALSLGGMTSSLTQNVGALTLTANSIFDFGTLLAGNTFKFAASNGVWTGLQLSIYNYSLTLDHLYFGNSSSGLNAAQLGQITFYSDAGTTSLGTAQYLLMGEVAPVPVPEPGTWLAALLAVVALSRLRSKSRTTPRILNSRRGAGGP